jgi:hypothetical protein
LGAVEEEPHAQRLGPLNGHQTHLTADMVAIFEEGNLGLIELGIFLQAGDPLFDGVTEAGADFEIFAYCKVSHHGVLLNG